MTTILSHNTGKQKLEVTDDGEESCGKPYTHMVVLWNWDGNKWVCEDDIQFESFEAARAYYGDLINGSRPYGTMLRIV